nr:ribonuclease H-like domain-containing protein [Tanacetum cinerariifolium]
GAPQDALKDQGYFDNGCSRHVTGNISYLTEFKEHDGGYVAFGGGAKGGKITGKGTIRTGLLDSKCDVCKVFCLGCATFTKGLDAAVLIGLSSLTGAAALEELCLAVLIGTMPDLVKIAVGAKFLLELEKF